MLRIVVLVLFFVLYVPASAETLYQGQLQLITGDVVTIKDKPFLLEVDVLWNTNDYLLGLAYFGPKIGLGKAGNLFALTGASFDNTGQVNLTAALWHVARAEHWNFVQIADMYFPISDGERQFYLASMGKRGTTWQVGYRAEAFGIREQTAFVSAGPVIEHAPLKLRFWLASDVYRADRESRAYLRISKVF